VETWDKDTFLWSDERTPECRAKKVWAEEERINGMRMLRDVCIERPRVDALSHPGELILGRYLLATVKRELNWDPYVKITRIHQESMDG
jgi:hypothetical protein